MLQALINIISESGSAKETSEVLAENLPVISSAMSAVNGMIADVMEIGAESQLTFESVEPVEIINTALRDIFSYDESLDIDISFEFKHKNLVSIDVLKTVRVLSNIIGNAVEHMKGKGHIWFHTWQDEDFIRFCIGNSNSFIHSRDIESLFDAFYTKGKKGGTGLGLAIAKKITEAHGGQIWCESSISRGTQFFITLPSATESTNKSHILPPRSRFYLKKIPLSEDTEVESKHQKTDMEKSLIRGVIPLLSARKGPFKIAIVDDERIYKKSIKSQIESLTDNKVLDQKIIFKEFSNGSELRGCEDRGSYDLVILDVDLGRNTEDGFDICKALRREGFNGKICVHSNRGVLDYQPKALEFGADFFLPKPMAREHLLSLIIDSLSDKKEEPQTKILLFEDESIYQRQWARKIGKDRIICAKTWEEFAQGRESFDWENIEFIITDSYLSESENGIDIAEKLREYKFNKPIFLCSNLDEIPDCSEGLIDLLVSKSPDDAMVTIKRYMKKLGEK